MRNKFVIIVMLLCGLAVNVLGQEEKSRLSGFMGSPVAGTRLEIQYDPTGRIRWSERRLLPELPICIMIIVGKWQMWI